MKAKVINANGRSKKFIGAAIGAAANIVGGIIGRAKAKRAARKQARAAQNVSVLNAETDAAQEAAAIDQQFANQEYVDEAKNKISLKNGGRYKNTRTSLAKRYKCGGRKKAFLGMTKEDWKKEGKEAVDSGISSAGTIGSSMLATTPKLPVPGINKVQSTFSQAKQGLKKSSWETDNTATMANASTDYAGTNDPNSTKFRDRLQQAKLGKRCRRK